MVQFHPGAPGKKTHAETMIKTFSTLMLLISLMSGNAIVTGSNNEAVSSNQVASDHVDQSDPNNEPVIRTDEWLEYVNDSMGFSLKYPPVSIYSGNPNCHSVPLTVIEVGNVTRIVQDRIYDEGTDCLKYRLVNLDNWQEVYSKFFIIANKAKSVSEATTFVKSLYPHIEFELSEAGPIFEKNGSDVQYLFWDIKGDYDREDYFTLRGKRYLFSKENELLLIYPGKGSGPIMDPPGAEFAVMDSITFL